MPDQQLAVFAHQHEGQTSPDPVAIIRLLHIADIERWTRSVAK